MVRANKHIMQVVSHVLSCVHGSYLGVPGPRKQCLSCSVIYLQPSFFKEDCFTYGVGRGKMAEMAAEVVITAGRPYEENQIAEVLLEPLVTSQNEEKKHSIDKHRSARHGL